MRVLWITERYPPLGGGMAVSSARQVEGLRRLGFSVDVVAFTESDPRVVVRTVPRDGGTDWHLSRAPRRGLTAQRAWRIISQDRAGQPFGFAVGFGAGMPGYLAVTFAAWLRSPSLVLVRGNDFDQDWFEPHRSLWVREALSRASVIGAVSRDMVRRIHALYPDREVCMVPNGVDVSALELLPRDRRLQDEIRARLTTRGRKIIGLFGELKHKKGVAFWLGALRDTGLLGRVGLLVVGRWLDDETSQIIDDPVLAPESVHIPFSNRDRLPGFYTACDFVALPSLFEGMPNVLLEAMALGVVPIVSDAGAMGEVVRDGETGFVFPSEDRYAAAEATARALSMNDSRRKAMGERARDFVISNFSVEREAEVLKLMLLTQVKPEEDLRRT